MYSIILLIIIKMIMDKS